MSEISCQKSNVYLLVLLSTYIPVCCAQKCAEAVLIEVYSRWVWTQIANTRYLKMINIWISADRRSHGDWGEGWNMAQQCEEKPKKKLPAVWTVNERKFHIWTQNSYNFLPASVSHPGGLSVRILVGAVRKINKNHTPQNVCS